MRYLKRFNEELSNKLKDEVEILFKDKNMVCLIPKSQKMAYIYGYRTKWCNVTNDRFNELSFDYGTIVIAFLFKEKDNETGSYGYKLRLVYNPDTKTGDWGDNTGKHILDFNNIDPFEVPLDKDSEMNKRAYEKIHSLPEECKNAVRKYLSKEKEVNFIKKDTEYKASTKLQVRKYEDKKKYLEFKHDTLPILLELISKNPNYYVNTSYDNRKDRFVITYSIIKGKILSKEFKTFDNFRDGVIDIIQKMDI